MRERFAEYAASLPDDERDLFLSSIPFLIALIAGADRHLAAGEVEAVVDALVASTTVLGEDFRYSPPAQASFDVISARSEEGWTDESHERLAKLGKLVRALPSDLRAAYQDFVGNFCAEIAASSRDFPLFGTRVNEDEKRAILTVAEALGIPVIGKLHEATRPPSAR